MTLMLIIYLVYFIPGPYNAAADSSFEFQSEVGNKCSTDTALKHLDEFQTYFQPEFKFKDSIGLVEVQIKGKVKGSLDAQGEKFVDLRALNVSLSQGHWKTVFGFTEIPWGETFGIPVLDLVNPRDLRDPLFQDEKWVRQSVFLLDQKVFLKNTTFQFVVTPFPRQSLLPKPGSKYDPLNNYRPSRDFKDSSKSDLSDSEFGGKVNYLFENGLDLALIGFRHQNRNVVYSMETLSPTEIQIFPYYQNVFTLGLSGTIGFGQWVFRTDQALHFSQPLQLSEPARADKEGRQWQGALGADFNANEVGTYGVQLQGEKNMFSTSSGGKSTFLALGTRASKHFFSDLLELEFFGFLGIHHSDLWLQPKATLHFLERWSFSLRADFVRSSERPFESYLWALDRKHRFLSILSIQL